jgi:hypothetical protein
MSFVRFDDLKSTFVDSEDLPHDVIHPVCADCYARLNREQDAHRPKAKPELSAQ